MYSLASRGSDVLDDDDLLHGGSTALVSVIDRGFVHVANLGDCRAVLGRGSSALRLSSDHTPALDSERDRILSLGGTIRNNRVHGILAVTRALGDLELQPFVSAEPQLRVEQLQPGDSYLLMASDGLWGKVSDDEALEIAMAQPTAQAAAEALVAEAERRGGTDNTSVIAVRLDEYCASSCAAAAAADDQS